jgi:hypothetical protein
MVDRPGSHRAVALGRMANGEYRNTQQVTRRLLDFLLAIRHRPFHYQ